MISQMIKKKNKKSMVDELHFYNEKLNIVSGEDIEMVDEGYFNNLQEYDD